MLLAGGFVGRLKGVEAGLERCLGVDHDGPATGQMDDHVGPQATFLGVHGHLFVEVAMLGHAPEFHDAVQLHLAPPTARLRTAEGVDQVLGLLAEFLAAFLELGDVFAQARHGLGALVAQFLHLLVHLAERFAQGLHDLVDGLLALAQIALGALLMLLERGLGEFEETLVAGFEGARGQGLEDVGEFLFGLAEKGLLLLHGLAFFVEGSVEARYLGLLRGRGLMQFVDTPVAFCQRGFELGDARDLFLRGGATLGLGGAGGVEFGDTGLEFLGLGGQFARAAGLGVQARLEFHADGLALGARGGLASAGGTARGEPDNAGAKGDAGETADGEEEVVHGRAPDGSGCAEASREADAGCDHSQRSNGSQAGREGASRRFADYTRRGPTLTPTVWDSRPRLSRGRTDRRGRRSHTRESPPQPRHPCFSPCLAGLFQITGMHPGRDTVKDYPLGRAPPPAAQSKVARS